MIVIILELEILCEALDEVSMTYIEEELLGRWEVVMMLKKV